MVTKLGERGQVGIRGAAVTDEWEQLVKFAAKRNGQTFSDFIVDVTRTAALAIVKHKPDTPDDTPAEPEGGRSTALPVRIEDVAASLHDQLAQLAERQHVDLAQLAADQKERLARIERHARRGRWRR